MRSVCERSRLFTACVAASTLADGLGTDIAAGAGDRVPAGAAAGVNWPPNVLVDTDWALWIAICRWKACSSLRKG